jgi:hypothetical protein
MAVGLPAKTTYVNGDVFSASDINDTNGTINLIGQTQNFYAGKNRIINGDFGIWQRGTSFTPTNGSYTADRFVNYFDGTGSTRTYSQQAFTLGTAPVAGYESAYFLRLNQSVAGTTATYNELDTSVEDVRTFAGQTATYSFWAKAASATTLPSIVIRQFFGSGGSPSANVDTTIATNVSLTTSWVRYSYTVSLPSIAGKTMGTNVNSSYLQILNGLPLNSTFTIDIWGLQLEAGSTATAFENASGSVGGELDLCQRYFIKYTSDFFGLAYNVFQATAGVFFPIQMRIAPTMSNGSFSASSGSNGTFAVANITPKAIQLYNSAANWTTGASVTVTMDVSAEL